MYIFRGNNIMATEKGKWIKGSGSYTEYRYRSQADKGYVNKQHSDATLRDNPDSFISKWGIHANDLAKQEGVHTATIHMRVLNYGTPFQRKTKPTKCEQIHHKTDYELALELDLHPQSVRRRVNTYGDAYRENPHHEHPLRGKVISATDDWRSYTKKTKFWLHPSHENYPHAHREGL